MRHKVKRAIISMALALIMAASPVACLPMNVFAGTGNTGTTTVPPNVNTMKFENPPESVDVGTSKTFKLEIDPKEAMSGVKLESLAPEIVAVSQNGENITIKGLKKGSAAIKATSADGKIITHTVKVEIPATSLTIDSDMNSDTIEKGKSFMLVANAEPAEASDSAIVWESSAPDVVEVESYPSGVAKITAKKSGIAIITAALGECKQTITVNVKSPVTRIYFISDSVSMSVGDEMLISACVEPDDADNKNIDFSIDDTDIASISKIVTSTGAVKVKANKAGKTKIIATAEDEKADLDIIVGGNAIVDIPDGDILVGNENPNTFTLRATVLPAGLEDPSNKLDVLKWASEDKKVATVDESTGKVTAVAPGETTITATLANNEEISCKITVAGVKLLENEKSMEVGDAPVKLGAEVYPSGRTVRWTSSDEKVATVNESTGEVTAVASGVATITVIEYDKDGVNQIASAECEVTVDSMLIKNSPVEAINRNATVDLDAVMFLDQNTDVDGVTWTSSNKEVATVDEKTGEVTAVAPGKTTITATASDGKTAICDIIVAGLFIGSDGKVYRGFKKDGVFDYDQKEMDLLHNFNRIYSVSDGTFSPGPETGTVTGTVTDTDTVEVTVPVTGNGSVTDNVEVPDKVTVNVPVTVNESDNVLVPVPVNFILHDGDDGVTVTVEVPNTVPVDVPETGTVTVTVPVDVPVTGTFTVAVNVPVTVTVDVPGTVNVPVNVTHDGDDGVTVTVPGTATVTGKVPVTGISTGTVDGIDGSKGNYKFVCGEDFVADVYIDDSGKYNVGFYKYKQS